MKVDIASNVQKLINNRMNYNNCARQTSSLLLRYLIQPEPTWIPQQHTQPMRFFTTVRQNTKPRRSFARAYDNHPTRNANHTRLPDEFDGIDSLFPEEEEASQAPQFPDWRAHKAAMKAKLNGEAWNPRKKLSPDTMEGIRHLHNTNPSKFTTPVLADHFKVSSEAIRRILKSKWRPNDAEYEARMERWDKRGERIWSNLVEMGVKPPKRWREMGVGKAEDGEMPKWKGRRRIGAIIGESVGGDHFQESKSDECLIPFVKTKGRGEREISVPLSKRI